MSIPNNAMHETNHLHFLVSNCYKKFKERERNKTSARVHTHLSNAFICTVVFVYRSRLGTQYLSLSLTSIRTSVDLFIISPGILVVDFRFFLLVTQFTHVTLLFLFLSHYYIVNSLLWECRHSSFGLGKSETGAASCLAAG